MRFAILFSAAALLAAPTFAEEKRKSTQDDGVQEAIRYQRAKDRADAEQARKEAKHPEKFTYAPPKSSSDESIANEQKRDALQKSDQKK
jgi:hypothetical protein